MKSYPGYLTTTSKDSHCYYCNQPTNQKVRNVNYWKHRVYICKTCNELKYKHYELVYNNEKYLTNYKTISEIVQDIPKKWVDDMLKNALTDINPERLAIFQYNGEISSNKLWERAENILDSSKNKKTSVLLGLIRPYVLESAIHTVNRQFKFNYLVKVNDFYEIRTSTIDWEINNHPCETKYTKHSYKEGCLQVIFQSILSAQSFQYSSKYCFYVNTKLNEVFYIEITDDVYERISKFLKDNGIYQYNHITY